jgi:1-acyl-sn-glycerol-3-phosphate acyltransferase
LKIIFILRSVLASVVFVGYTIFTSIIVIILSFFKNRKWADKAIYAWACVSTFVYGVRVFFSGQHNIPKEGCLFVFNHSSHFDIICIYDQLRKSSRFGAKIELYKIPIFGQALKASDVLPIARGEKQKVFQLYEDSIPRVHAGESFILACEGTRQPTPGVGERFKAGPFIFAIQGQFPLVPIVIKGAAECMPKHEILPCKNQWRYNVLVQVLPAISTKGLTLDDRQRLQDDVRNLMTKVYNES